MGRRKEIIETPSLAFWNETSRRRSWSGLKKPTDARQNFLPFVFYHLFNEVMQSLTIRL